MSRLELLLMPFMQRAVVGLVFASMTLSLLGIVILVLNLTTIRFSLMHLGLLGATVGIVTGTDALVSGLIAIGAGSALFGPISDRTHLDVGPVSALFMTGSLALTFLLLYKANIPAMEAFSIFTGNVLALTAQDLWITIVLGAGIVCAMIIWYWEINLILSDRELAEVSGIRATSLFYMLVALTGLAIGVSIRLVGALMVDAIMLLPAMVAMPLARSLKGMMILTALFGVLISVSGFTAAVWLDLPIGVSVAIAGVVMLGITQVIRSCRTGHKAVRKTA